MFVAYAHHNLVQVESVPAELVETFIDQLANGIEEGDLTILVGEDAVSTMLECGYVAFDINVG